MNKVKITYTVLVKLSYCRMFLNFEDAKDAEYFVECILMNLDKEASDSVEVSILPQTEEVKADE